MRQTARWKRKGKVTVESIRPRIDLDKVQALLRELAECNDYERRLLAMGLKGLNDGAEYLPTCAYVLLDPKARTA